MKSVTCSRTETSLFKPFSGTDYLFRPHKALAVIPVSEPFNGINFSVHMKLLTSFRSLNSYNAIKAFHMTGHSLQYCWHKPHLQVGSISFQVLQSHVMSLHNNVALHELARPLWCWVCSLKAAYLFVLSRYMSTWWRNHWSAVSNNRVI